jgi:hypothetical protein
MNYAIIREATTLIKMKKLDRFGSFAETLDIVVNTERMEIFIIFEFASEDL